MSNKPKTPETKEESGCGKSSLIGCGVVIALIFLLVSGCNALFDGDDDTEVVVTETTTTETTTKKAPANKTPGVKPIDNAEVEAWAKSQFGGSPEQSWIELASNDMAPIWAYPITDVYLDGSTLVFKVQVDRSEEGPEVAEAILTFFGNSLTLGGSPSWANQVSFIQVVDGTSTHIKQKSLL